MISPKFAILAAFLLSACVDPSMTMQPYLVSGPTPISGYTPDRPAPLPAFHTRSTAEVNFITSQLNALQSRSIAENREYCGLLGRDASGNYQITRPTRGGVASCQPSVPPSGMRVIASYHTHAAYSPRYDGEVPSEADLVGDMREKINGYVSTPGGRLWFVDGLGQEVVQICGLNCLNADPRFQPEPGYPVLSRYSLAGLRAR